MKEVERLKEVEAAVHVQTMDFLEKKRNQLQEDVDAWDGRYMRSNCSSSGATIHILYVRVF